MFDDFGVLDCRQIGERRCGPHRDVHSLANNPSSADKAKFLVVFVAREGAELANFEEAH
jgi:hypothetical protein